MADGWFGAMRNRQRRIATAGLTYWMFLFVLFGVHNGNDTDDIGVYRFGELIDRFGEWVRHELAKNHRCVPSLIKEYIDATCAASLIRNIPTWN